MNDELENQAGLIRFVPGNSRYPETRWYFGLDLGQRRDHSALAALELTWTSHGRCPVTFAALYQPELAIRSLIRFPLGTSYDALHGTVSARLATCRLPVRRELVIDAGGPGPPMVDRLRQTLPSGVAIRPVIITGGKGANALTGGYTGIPRRTLLSNLLLTMAAHSLTCWETLDHWEEFEAELIELRGDSMHPAGSAHDDLVLAVALALSAAVRDTPQLLPQSEDKKEEKRNFGFIDKPLF